MEKRLNVNIVSSHGNVRNSSLLLALQSLIPKSRIDVINGSKSQNSIKKLLPNVDAARELIYVGRKITEPERAALRSHTMAQTCLGNLEWTLILEDDAEITALNDFKRLMLEISSIQTSRPTIVLLHLGKFGLVVKSVRNRFFDRVIKIPSGAVAYAVNSGTRELISRTKPIVGLADWPNWINGCQVLAAKQSVVQEKKGLPSLANVNLVEDDATIIGVHLRNFYKRLRYIFDDETIALYGNRKTYLYRVVLSSMLWRLSSIPLLNQFLKRTK